jgi:hypothetical protein
MFHLITSKITNRIGIFSASVGIMAADMEWPEERYRKGIESLPKGFLRMDESRRLMYLPGWFDHNGPSNPNVLKGWISEYNEVPDCELKREYFRDLTAYVSGLTSKFRAAFRVSFEESAKPFERLSASNSNSNSIDQTPPGENSSSKDDNEQQPDVGPVIEHQDVVGQVDEPKNTPAKSTIDLLRELWPDLDDIMAEQYYLRIRSGHRELELDKLESIIRKAWSKWPVGRSIHEGSGIGAWIGREIEMVLRGERIDAERKASAAHRQAQYSGTGPIKANVKESLRRLERDLLEVRQKGESGRVFEMVRIQGVINEAVEDGIHLPEVVISWLNKGAKSGAFELGDGHKLISFHLDSGRPTEVIKAPPSKMTKEEVDEQIRLAREKLGIDSPKPPPKEPEEIGKVPRENTSLDPEERRMLEAAMNRSSERARSAPSQIGDLLGTALGAEKDGK